MASCRFLEIGGSHRALDGLLYRRRVDMMAANDTRARLRSWAARGEQELPAKLQRSIRVLSRQGMWKPHTFDTPLPITVVLELTTFQLSAKRHAQLIGHRHDPILAALAMSDHDGPMREVQILDPSPNPSSIRAMIAQDIGFTRDCSTERNAHCISEGEQFLVDSRDKRGRANW